MHNQFENHSKWPSFHSQISQIRCNLIKRLVVMCPFSDRYIGVHTPESVISLLWGVWTLLSSSVCICNKIFEKHTKMAFRNLSLDLTKTFLRQTFWLKWKKEANKALFMIGMNKTLLSKSMQSHVILEVLPVPLTFCLNNFNEEYNKLLLPTYRTYLSLQNCTAVVQ